MAVEIQHMFRCKYYTPNQNLNLTCCKEPQSRRCWIFYEVHCPSYEEKGEENGVK